MRRADMTPEQMEEIRGRASRVFAWSDDPVAAALGRDCAALLSSLQAAQARVGVLEKALAPFAGWVPSSQFPGCGEFTGADLKAARQALSEGGGS